MRFRRCSILFLEAHQHVSFDLTGLAGGGDGLHERLQWRAWAPHLEEPLLLDDAQCQLLGRVSPTRWCDEQAFNAQDQMLLPAMIEAGLLVVEEGATDASGAAARDQAMRNGHWWPPAAVLHRAARWQGQDSAAAMEERRLFNASDLRAQLGVPPSETVDRGQLPGLALPRAPADAAIAGHRRVTCRNFDPARPITATQLSAVLAGSVMAHARVDAGEDVAYLKKAVPAAGSLHASEAYLWVQQVEGVPAGLYHYRPLDHALAALPLPVSARIEQWLAGQHWFADAAVHVLLSVRHGRTFWKYRNHAKAYRALLLDLGHVSQAVYTEATAQGLAAYVTAAINEVDIEQGLGLDPMHEGVLLACGFGWRGPRQVMPELDPLGSVWPR